MPIHSSRNASVLVLAASALVAGCSREPPSPAPLPQRNPSGGAARVVAADESKGSASTRAPELPIATKTNGKPSRDVPPQQAPTVPAFVVIEGRFAGASQFTVEKQLARYVEPEFAALAGSVSIQSASWPEHGRIWIRLAAGADPRQVRQEAAEKLAAIQAELPPPAQVTLSRAGNWSIVLLLTAHSSVLSPQAVRTQVDHVIAPRLRAVRGVADVVLIGAGRTRLAIAVSLERLGSRGLTLSDITGAVRDEASVGMPDLEEAEAIGRLQDTVLAVRDGQAVQVRDVAEVIYDEEPDPYGGPPQSEKPPPIPATLIGLILDGDADAAVVRRAVSTTLDGLASRLPPELKLDARIPQQQAPLLSQTVRILQRLQPPGQRLERITSETTGDLLRVSTLYASIRVPGTDLEVLGDAVGRVARELKSIDGIDDVQTEPMPGPPGLLFAIDQERCSRFGATRSEVAAALALLRHGQNVGHVWDGAIPRKVAIVVRETAGVVGTSESVEALQRAPLFLTDGRTVPVDQLVDIRIVEAPQVVLRQDLTRMALVSFRVDAAKSEDVLRLVRAAIDELSDRLPHGTQLELVVGTGNDSSK